MTTALFRIDVQRNMLEQDVPVPGAGEVRPALESLLARARAAGPVVVHVQSEYGVAETSRGALRHGFEVLVASSAHATCDEDDSAAEIAAAVEPDLAKEGVTVLPAADVAFR